MPRAPRLNNRELSWLEFNSRVLDEARDPSVPLLERLKFLAIFSSNLDEFFMVRVAGLWRQVDAGVTTPGDDGRTPREILDAVSIRAHELVHEQHRIMLDELLPALATEGIHLVRQKDWSAAQLSWLRDWFLKNALPIVTPIAIDPSHPFPHIANRTLCLALEIEADDDDDLAPPEFGILHIPAAVLPRFLRLPSPPGQIHVALLEDTVRANLDQVFRNAKILSAGAIRVTRDAELDYDEDRADDLLRTIEIAVRERRLGGAVRLQHEPGVSAEFLPRLVSELELEPGDVYGANGLTAFADLFQLYAMVNRPDLKFPAWTPVPHPRFARNPDMFKVIDRGDVLVHHPYQSFDHVVRFIEAAAQDPDVLAIKMTLYRMTKESRIAQALVAAAQQGKSVAALVELRARFNEESNIAWAKRLESAGAHVVYGMTGLKTHAKAALVVRRTKGAIRRYCHLGTGNYNENNASTYTDFSLFTSRSEVGEDLTWMFNLLTGYARPPAFAELLVAPMHFRDAMVERLRREVSHAKAGRASGVVLKLNSLVDPTLIEELYRTAKSGVHIDIIVRGICCLRPGVPGLSENIRAVRIVDRFLEHARLFRFQNGDDPEYLLSSADWMQRNLDGRIEIAFPIHDAKLRRELDKVVELQLTDNVKSTELSADGRNLRGVPDGAAVRSQLALMKLPAKK